MTAIKPIVAAMLLALPLLANAQTNEQLRTRVETLETEIAQLKTLVASATAALKAVTPVATVDPAEFERVRVKVDGIEDARETSGLNGLKISGLIDPVYVYNHRSHRGSTQFLNGQKGTEVNDLSQDVYGYDNSNFGGATLKFEKTFTNGIGAMLTLRPNKSATGIDSILEEATMTVPVGDGMAFVAGKMAAFNGYEYSDAFRNKSITHNLLWDFGGPSFVTGAGLNFSLGNVAFKTAAGNLNTYRDTPGSKNQGVHWRADVYQGEFSGWGVAGLHGNMIDHRFNYLEADYWYTRGDWTLNAQVEGSTYRDGGFDGGDTGHTGASALVAYKLTPQWEIHARTDWMDNSKNGGGGPAIFVGEDDGTNNGCLGLYESVGSTTPAALCGDYRNGFGPGAVFDPVSGGWALGNPSRGTIRTAFTVGVNYQFVENGLIKLEYRYDRSNLRSFYDYAGNNFWRSNDLISLQSVLAF